MYEESERERGWANERVRKRDRDERDREKQTELNK